MRGGSRIRGRAALLALTLSAALLAAAPAAQAQFGIERDPDPFQDGWIAQVFADDAELTTDAYSNTGGGKHDPYPVPDPDPGQSTGVYELAGGHPFVGVTDFAFRRESGDEGPPVGGNVANVRVDIPRGLMPNPGQFVRCDDDQLENLACPLASQIGTEQMTVYISTLAGVAGDIELTVPLYNMTPLSHPEDLPRRDVPARFGFNPAEAVEAILPLDTLPPLVGDLVGIGDLVDALVGLHPVHIVGGVRDAPSPAFGPFDYGLYFTIDHLPEYDSSDPASPGVIRSKLTFWGVPGDDVAHSDERGVSCVSFESLETAPLCTPVPGTLAPDDTPFLTSPTECTGTDLVTRLSVWSHHDASDQIDESTPAIEDVSDGIVKHGAQGCDENVPFEEGVGIDVDPQQGGPDSPSGPRVGLLVDQEGLETKDEFATSHVEDVSVTLPPGMTINPSAANGLQACTDAQFAAGIGVPGGEACPPGSKIGTVRAISPVLPVTDDPLDTTPGQLSGSAYVGQPLPGDMYRLFVTIEGRQISVRLKGTIRPNPSTGQLTATFASNPQLPFTELSVDFRDGARAPLATPLDCGPKQAAARLTPWSGTAPADATSGPFAIAGAGCPPGFAPGFGVATASSAAGAFSPFTATISRPDRNQFLSGVRVDTPPGLAAMISRAEQCPDAQAATGACPAASRVGTVRTAAGAGPEPYRLSGPVYLTQSYKGAPFGMVAVIRAIAGPYDLGTVVVRQQIRVDPEDASVTVISDPLPRILEGVPIRLRTAQLSLDKPGFAFNPTSCGVKRVGAALTSTAGARVARNAALAIDRCDRLRFAPKMAMRLIGPRQMRFGGHPRLRAVVRQAGRQANIARARVALPASIALDPRNSQNVCDVEAAQRADCPASTRIGFARAVSPALDEPLRGPVYFVQGIRVDPETGNEIRTLPSLLAKLRGEIAINLRGTTAVEGRRQKLVSTFEPVPDAPVSRFAINVRGGPRGPLAVTARRGICGRRQIARSRFVGHNGKSAGLRVNMRKPCRDPRLRIRRVRERGNRLVVRGTAAKRARRRVKVAVRCGKRARTARRARRLRAGRWGTAVRLHRRCRSARRATVRVSYPGGGGFRPATAGRRVTLRAGS